VRFALLGHPTVQVIRFLSKAGLVWFLSTEDFGRAALAGILALLGQELALFGLEEALIAAPAVDQALWRRVRRFLHASGALVGVVLGTMGLVWTALDDGGEGRLVVALAPLAWLGNLGVARTALLARARRFAGVFVVDLASAGAMAVASLVSAASGAGAWSLVLGWYAGAFASVVVARWCTRGFAPDPPAAMPFEPLRYGAHMCASTFGGLLLGRIDALAVGLLISRAALGLYEFALGLSLVLFEYASQLAGRAILPWLAERRRSATLPGAYRDALHLGVVFLLPAHVVLAVLAPALVALAFPAGWRGAGTLLPVLALAAGARSMDLLATTALKALGAGEVVVRLALLRLAVLAVAVALGVAHGVLVLACCVLAAHVLSCLVVLACARRRPELAPPGPRSALGLRFLCAWSAIFALAARLLGVLAAGRPLADLILGAGVAAVTWVGLRLLLDRRSLDEERQRLLARLARGPQGLRP
jgi:O-antigen/teichoic acid export membrane protein